MPISLRHSGPVVVFALILFCARTAQAQSPAERHQKLRAAVEERNYAGAVTDLQAIRTTEPSIFSLNNYDYLLARLSERRGDMATAAAGYQAVVIRNSMLSQYALWHLARVARSTGNLILEREQLRQLFATAPTSLLRAAALARLGQSFFESGDYPAAISTLRTQNKTAGGAGAREALALIGQAYLHGGQQAAAREAFNNLVTQLPDPSRPDDFALTGARGLDVLDGGSEEAAQRAAPQLAESEHLRRALIYSFNRDFAAARRHYLAIVQRYGQSPGVPDALYQIGRGFYQELRFEDAISYFQRVVSEYPNSPSARDALGFTAASYTRLKRTDEAVAAYRLLIDRYPNAPNPERPFLNIIDALREAGREAEALSWVEQTRSRFKGQIGATLALFSQARIHLVQGAWSAALVDLDALKRQGDLGGTRVSGGTSQSEVGFTRAYVLEQTGRAEEAINAYLEIADGRGEYYGGRATRRLRALAFDERTRDTVLARMQSLRANAQQALAGGRPEDARRFAQSAMRLTEDSAVTGELLEIARRAYTLLPNYSRMPVPRLLDVGRREVITTGPRAGVSDGSHLSLARELLFLGLYDEGAPELAVAGNAFGGAGTEGVTAQEDSQSATADRDSKKAQTGRPNTRSIDEAYTLAVLFKRGERANHAIRFAELLWKNIPGDYLLELAPREMAELLYPAPYSAVLLESGPPRGVDPRFILAIARQESRFQPEVKSVSAARGLLQFIPSTASAIATQLGESSFRPDDLYDPRIAILFGSQYMGNLFKQFPDMLQAVAASYNGGEDNVARWVARAGSNDPDRYVPEIGFTQTKDYVFKVLPNFWSYQKLYTEKLERH